jgi:hypothetical protein
MEAIQLELFKEMDFEKKHTYIKKKDIWYLFDWKRNRETCTLNGNYNMTFCCVTKKSFPRDALESKVLFSDSDAKIITLEEYLELAQLLKNYGLYKYNKKLGEAVLKLKGKSL